MNDQLDGEIRALLARLEDMSPLPPTFDELHHRIPDAGQARPRWRRPAVSAAAAVVVASALAATVAIIQARPTPTPSAVIAAPSTESAGLTTAPSAAPVPAPPLVDADEAARLLPDIVIDGGPNQELTRLDVDGSYTVRLVSGGLRGDDDTTFCIIEEANGAEIDRWCGNDDNPRADVGGLVETAARGHGRGGPRMIVLTAATVTVAADNCDPVTATTATVALSVCSPSPDEQQTELTFTNTLDRTVLALNVPIRATDETPTPSLLGRHLAPEIFPALPVADPRDETAEGTFSQINPLIGARTSALIARRNGDLLTDGIQISAYADRDDALAGQVPSSVTIHGVDVDYVVEAGNPAITTAIVPGEPAIAYRGLDPLGFLTDAGLDVASSSTDPSDQLGARYGMHLDVENAPVLNLVDVPDGYDVIVEPEPLPLGAVTATLHLKPGDTADATAITTQVGSSALIAMASAGGVRVVDINGTPGWMTTGPDNAVTWHLYTTLTWISVTGNATPDASLDLARATQFIHERPWRARYHVAPPNFTPATGTSMISLDPGPPPRIPYTELESTVIDALAEVGLYSGRAKGSSPDGPAIIDVFLPGPHGTLRATPIAVDQGEYSVVDERDIRGVNVQHVQHPGGLAADVFTCRDIRYEHRGPTHPAFADLDQFLGQLIKALGCNQPD